MVPPLQTALVVTAELTSMTALSSRSVKERAPLLERACAEAFASSVNPKSAIAAEICGASLVPVMVTWTVSVSVSLLLSVMVTV